MEADSPSRGAWEGSLKERWVKGCSYDDLMMIPCHPERWESQGALSKETALACITSVLSSEEGGEHSSYVQMRFPTLDEKH